MPIQKPQKKDSAQKKEKAKNKRLVLLDAHAILHRAYHALPDFASSRGEPTGGLYGLSTMLIKIAKELKPDYIVACYDLPEPTYRHEAYEEYKAGRAKADLGLVAQLERSKDVFSAFNIPIYSKAGFEADDILGTIVNRLKKNKELDIIIASGDMDTLQLVHDKKVQVYTLKKGIKDTILYDEDAVKERFGFGPKLLPDYKGLRGDPSDNIPGIAGIGEKTATELITRFGSIEEIYKSLKKNKKSFEEAGIKERVIKLLEEGEEEAKFSKMLATIHSDVPIDFSLPEKCWRDDVSMEKVSELFRILEFRTIAARVKEALGFLQRGEESPDSKTEKDPGSQSLFSNEVLPREVEELAIAVWLLDSTQTNPTADDILVATRSKSFDAARKIIIGEIKEKGLLQVYNEIELPLIPIVKKMKERGVLIDKDYLKKLSLDYHKKLSILEKEIWKEAGEEFNINSPKQLGEILFDKLGISAKNQKKTSTGAKSTRESELQKMSDGHPIIPLILEYREFQKLLSTYIDNIPAMLDSKNRLHARFAQAGTTTGRMSSNDPNLQNIPIRTELGRNIRKAFIASPGFKIVAIDYSQIELRVAAILSGDKRLVQIFKEGGDVHRQVAAYVFGVSPDEVDYEMRRRAKVINFGILYGMGVNALKQNLGTSREDAQNFYDRYFDTFSGLAIYLDEVKAAALRSGFTETLFGRRRYFQGIKSRLPYIRAAAERMAINAPAQGTAADIIKIAMREADAFIEESNLQSDVYLLLQVHDELVYEIKEQKLKEAVPRIKDIMESVLSAKQSRGVPLLVEVSVGDNWSEMKKF